MNLRKITAAKVIALLAVVAVILGMYTYLYFEGKVSSQLTQTYNHETERYTATLSFEIFGLRKPTDVEVIALNPNNTVEYLSVEIQGKQYVSEKYEGFY